VSAATAGTVPASGVAARMHRAAVLKERVYVAFTTLAVVVTLRAHGAEPAAGAALGTLAVTVAATTCAVYAADLLSHMVVHGHLPSGGEHRGVLASSLGAGAVALPSVACLGLAALGWYDAATGLLAAVVVTSVTLAAIGVAAALRLDLSRGRRLAVLGAELLVSLLVLALGLLAHR